MKILDVRELSLPGVLIIRFGRFSDMRGYFTETFRRSDLETHEECTAFRGVNFVQSNESFSRAGTVRGLHFQWNPVMGKLVRTIQGHMMDVVLDIRQGSPTYGRVVCYDMPSHPGNEFSEWIWVPPGFAHGNVFLMDTTIEYFCSGEYSPGCEASISPLSQDLDWSLCDPQLASVYKVIVPATQLITEKDKLGLSLNQWTQDQRSENFVYAAS
jgi:dTDP-4-dehydrorhamnose 3,5-epimerase